MKSKSKSRSTIPTEEQDPSLPPNTYAGRGLYRMLNKKIEYAYAEAGDMSVDAVGDREEFEEENPDLFKYSHFYMAKRNAVRQFIKDIEEFTLWMRKEYWREFRKDPWPTEWMIKSKSISQMLELKRNQYLIPLLNYLWRNTMDIGSCKRLANNKGIEYRDVLTTKHDRDIERPYAFIESLDYKKMGRKLGMSNALIRKHLQELSHLGILRRFRKSGPRDQMIYAIGYYSPYADNKWRVYPFLKGTKEMKRTLLQFNPYR